MLEAAVLVRQPVIDKATAINRQIYGVFFMILPNVKDVPMRMAGAQRAQHDV